VGSLTKIRKSILERFLYVFDELDGNIVCGRFKTALGNNSDDGFRVTGSQVNPVGIKINS
jgi:hypothetical protein